MIINIRGNSGSGKTTLTRAFMSMSSEYEPGSDEPDQLLRISGRRWAILGRYLNECGGCDTIKTQAEIIKRVRYYTKEGMNVWLEGLILSTIYGSVGAFSESYGNDWVFAYLDTPLDVCLKRVLARRKRAGNTKPFNEKNTVARDATIKRNREIVLSHGRRVVDLPYQNALSPLLKIIRKEGL